MSNTFTCIINKYWQIVASIISMVFAFGILFSTVQSQSTNIDKLDQIKADKTAIRTIEDRTNILCETKLDKTVFGSHEKRDDERFSIMRDDITKRLDRIENKIDNIDTKQ